MKKKKLKLFLLLFCGLLFLASLVDVKIQDVEIEKAEAAMVCHKPLDVMFAVDRSASLSSGDFAAIKSATSDFIYKNEGGVESGLFASSPDWGQHEAGLIAFNNNVSSFSLTEDYAFIQSKINDPDGILGSKYPLAGPPSVSGAVGEARVKLSSGLNPTKVLVVIIGGAPDSLTAAKNAVQKAAEEEGIIVITVGVNLDKLETSKKSEAEEFLKYPAEQGYGSCYYASSSGNSLDGCTSVYSSAQMEDILNDIYNRVGASICDEDAPNISISRIPSGTLYPTDTLKIASTATDDFVVVGNQHYLKWSSDWNDPTTIVTVYGSGPNLVNCGGNICFQTTAEANGLGPFPAGSIINYKAGATDLLGNSAETNLEGVTVATVNLVSPRSEGLSYYYYDGTSFDTYKGSGVDTNLKHEWAGGQVSIGGNSWENQSDTVSIIWDGWVRPDTTGVYTFYVSTDDGIRLYIDGNLAIDEWFDQGTTEYSTTYDFTSLDPVPIRIEWYENGGYATMKLGWKPPAGSKTYPIPASNLIPSLMRNTDNIIKVNISDPGGFASADEFYIRVDNSSNGSNIIDETDPDSKMTCSGSGTNYACTYSLDPPCSYPDKVDISIYAKSADIDYHPNPIAKVENVGLATPNEGMAWGNCSDGIDNDCDGGKDAEETYSCDGSGPTVTVSRSPSGTVYDDDSITIASTASDENGIWRHSIYYKKEGDSGWTEVSESPGDGSISTTIGPFNAGEKIIYYAEAIDASPNKNSSSTAQEYFVVKSRECEGKGDLTVCSSGNGRCCSEVCDTSRTTHSYDLECAEDYCNGISWELRPANNGSDCSDGSNGDNCYSYETGCEERDYYCSDGKCVYSVSNRNTDYCSGSDLINYSCSGTTCSSSTQNDSPTCDLTLDSLSIDAYDKDGTFIVGTSGSVPAEVYDNKTDKISLKSSTYDYKGINGHKIYWKKSGETSYHEEDCGGSSSCTDEASACECVKKIGPFNAGDVVQFYAWAQDSSPNNNTSTTSVYSFTVRDHECYNISEGEPETDLTSCDSGNGRCCGGICDSSPGSNPYDSECSTDSCSGTNWVYAPANGGDPCGSGGCQSYYTGCVNGNTCQSGYCQPDPSGINVDSCSGNLLTDYECSGGTCSAVVENKDCSAADNYDSDSIPCNCDCAGYDIEEKVYSSLSFDGVDDYVDMGAHTTVDDSYTVEVWFKPSGNGSILRRGDSNSCFYNPRIDLSGSTLTVAESGCSNAGKIGDFSVTLNEWHHVAVTRDAETVKVYVDGSLKATDTSQPSPGSTAHGKFLVGAAWSFSNGTYNYFHGLIDEVRIYNRALYPEEVEDHYNGIFANDSGLVGYWNFDEGQGEVASDSSGNGHNGSLSNVDGTLHNMNNSNWVNGVYGTALDFDSSNNDYVSLPSINPTDAITVEAWVKSSSNSGYSGVWQIVSKYNAYILGTNSFGGKDMCFIIYDSTWRYGSCYTVPDPQNWHHFIGTYNKLTQEKKLYVDGVLRSTTSPSGSINADTGPVFVARRECCNDYFDGIIDEVRIYNRALSDAEVAEHYKGVYSDNSGLVGYWSFNEGSGDTAYDGSGNGPKWMKYHHNSTPGSGGNVPEHWQICTDSKNNDCDTTTDEYEGENSECDGELYSVSIAASAISRYGVEDDSLFPEGVNVLQRYDADIEKDRNGFTLSAIASDDFGVRETTIEWTADNWATTESKSCSGGSCKVCVGSAVGDSGTVSSATNATLVDDSKSWTGGAWNGWLVEIYSGTGEGQVREVISNTDKELTIDTNWTVNPDSTSQYRLIRNDCYNRDSGTAENGGNNYLVDTDKSWLTDEWKDGYIEIYDGTGAGQVRKIEKNELIEHGTKAKITVYSNWDTNPTNDSQYRLIKKSDIINSTFLSANHTFKFRVCAWDNSINANEDCSDEYNITVLSSNSAPVLSNLSVQSPNFCSQGLAGYVLTWDYEDAEGDEQAYYDIQIKKDDNDFSGNLTVDKDDVIGSHHYYIITAEDSLEYNKTYYWRVRATDDRGGGYAKTSDWKEGPNFTTPSHAYPQVEFSTVESALESGTATSGSEWKLIDSAKNWSSDEYKGKTVKIVSGTGAGQARNIVSNTSTELTVYTKWDTIPDSTSEYEIVESALESGTATSGSEWKLIDNTKSWDVDDYKGKTVKIVSGTGAGQARNIESNTSTELTVYTKWDTIPDSTSEYEIFDSCLYDFGFSSSSETRCKYGTDIKFVDDSIYKECSDNKDCLSLGKAKCGTDKRCVPCDDDHQQQCDKFNAGSIHYSCSSGVCQTSASCSSDDDCKAVDAPKCDSGSCTSCSSDVQCIKFSSERVEEEIGEEGRAEGGSANTLVDNDKHWQTDEWKDGYIEITAGTGNGQKREISQNSESTITVASPWTTVPDSTSRYNIVKYVCNSEGRCENKEHRKWNFDANQDSIIDSLDPNPIYNYINPKFSDYSVELEIKDIDGYTCSKTREIRLGGRKYPKWNEVPPSE